MGENDVLSIHYFYLLCNLCFLIQGSIFSRAFLPFVVSSLRYVESIMITINSSINFIIYYVLGESFRNETRKMLSNYFRMTFQICFLIFHFSNYVVRFCDLFIDFLMLRNFITLPEIREKSYYFTVKNFLGKNSNMFKKASLIVR